MYRPEAQAKRLVRQIGSYRERRSRMPPTFGVPAVASDTGSRIFYLCPDSDIPSGGIRVIYKHVDMLNSIGYSAAVVHGRPGFACTWFKHQTKTVAAREVNMSASDVLVVPEYYGANLGLLPDVPRLIIFNQNSYKTFSAAGALPAWQHYSRSGRIETMLVVSLDNKEYLRYAFPEIRVERIRNSVDSKIFHPGPAEPGRRLAVMPRRRAADWNQVRGLLTLRDCLTDWDVVEIDGKSEYQTAELLRSCAIFLSFSEQEGFGMPPAEAMACGCHVVGFTGLAGREFFYNDISTAVIEGDILHFAKEVEQAMRMYEQNPSALRKSALEGAARISVEYSPAVQLSELNAFYESLDLASYEGKRGTGGVEHEA
jgi:glycosyltransferase involved in cell wall biosynthesis